MLALLAVAARPLASTGIGGSAGPPGEFATGEAVASLGFRPIPRENVRAELRRKPGLAEGGGGTGISLYCACTLRSERASIDEGFVETLKREDEAALS